MKGFLALLLLALAAPAFAQSSGAGLRSGGVGIRTGADATLDSLTCTDATKGVIVSSNSKVCFDGSTCDKYIQYNTGITGFQFGDDITAGGVSSTTSMSTPFVQSYGVTALVLRSQNSSNADNVRVNTLSAWTGSLFVGQNNSTEKFKFTSEGAYINTSQAVTVADNGNGGTPATSTLTPTSTDVRLTCNDAQGCTMTMGETSVPDGLRVTITNISANTANFADTANVSETAGAFAAGQYDVLTLVYVTDRWIEVGRSNN